MKKIGKFLVKLMLVFFTLFGLSLIVYFFNLDMKAAAPMEKVMNKIYDKRKRDRRL